MPKKRAPHLWPKGIDALHALYDEFHLQYGKALAEWALLEQHLGEMFCWLCGFKFDHPLGRAIFYSGRSFGTRADLVAAAIRTSDRSAEMGELFAAILKKARQLSSSRNVIAHGVPQHLIGREVDYQGWRLKEGEFSREFGGVGLNELANAEKNYRLLCVICTRIMDRLNSSTRQKKIPVSDHLEQIRQIPSDGFTPASLDWGDLG